jgi:NADH pyrophosphatase NudC (nudix superfamily)
MSDFVFCPRCKAPLVDRLMDGAARRVCLSNCGFVYYDNPTPVVAAVVEHEDLVVLAHNRAWPSNWYGLITGFLERGESPPEAVLREVKEELGLHASEATLIGVYSFERMNQVIIGYHVLATGNIKLNEELDDFRRVAPAKCRTWPVATGFLLRDWLRSRGFEPEMESLGN